MSKNKFTYGLLGKGIDYSFSKNFFTEKFKAENLVNHLYKNFDCQNLDEVMEILKKKNLKGLNVTIPYKQEIIPFLDDMSNEAKEIGAVNTISFDKKGKSLGHNTDCYGFQKSLFENINKKIKAIILGTGGASKAIQYVLKKNSIEYVSVSRTKDKGDLIYEDLNDNIINEYELIINTTPLGTYPKTNKCPNINFNLLTRKHILFDLTYNPKKTKFLTKGEKKRCKIINGYNMLIYQAQKSWSIWNEIN